MYYLIDYEYNDTITSDWKRLPSVNCSSCNNIWGSSYIELIENYVEEDQTGTIFSNDGFTKFQKILSQKYSISIDNLLPGAKIGLPTLNLQFPNQYDFFMVFYGELYITNRIIKIHRFLQSDSIKINKDWSIIKFSNLVKSNIKEIVECRTCLRKSYVYPDEILLDETNLDFFHLADRNHILISDKIQMLMSNYKHNLIFRGI